MNLFFRHRRKVGLCLKINRFKLLILRQLNLGSKCPSGSISDHTQGDYSQKHPKRLTGAFPAKYGAFLNLGAVLIMRLSICNDLQLGFDTIQSKIDINSSKNDWNLLKINRFFFGMLARSMLQNAVCVSR
jgi:hypothetical protein